MVLLALVLQLGLSFGHVHGVHSDRSAAVLNATASDNDPGDGDDYCATCAILALLSGAQTAEANVLALPIVLATVECAVATGAIRIASPHGAFRSRAPPLS